MKFNVGFYHRGDLARSSLIAECVVDAINTGSAKTAAVKQLTPQYPRIGDCRYWHAGGFHPRKPGSRRAVI